MKRFLIISTIMVLSISATSFARYLQNPVAEIDGPNITCVNNSALYQATNSGVGATYSWSFGPDATPATSTEIDPLVEWATLGTKKIYLEVSQDGLTAQDSLTVTVAEAIFAEAGADPLICQGTFVKIGGGPTGPASATYSWFPSAGLNDATAANPIASVSVMTTYTVVVGFAGCYATDEVTIFVRDKPIAYAGEDTYTCSGEAVLLGGTSSFPTGPAGAAFYWSPASTLDDPFLPNPVASPIVTTTYTVTVEKDGCFKTDEVTIEVLPMPTVDAGDDQNICLGDSAEVVIGGAGNNPFASFQWTPTTGLSNPNSSNTLASPTQTTTYELCATRYNCVACEEITVTVEPCITPQLKVWLEGPYDSTANKMSTFLNLEDGSMLHRGLLPGQTPLSTTTAIPTPAGQPYSGLPWNYLGTEGAYWTNYHYDILASEYGAAVVDWILVSFRTDIQKTTTFLRVAALLLEDGRIAFIDNQVLNSLLTRTEFYVLIEHRNHMGIMTPSPISLVDNSIQYDFGNQNSYLINAGFGSKEISPGIWAMYAGEGNPTDDYSYDINSIDNIQWSSENGNSDGYYQADYNLNGDVIGADKILWSRNNGVSSRVPR